MNASIRGLRVLPSCLGATPRHSKTLDPCIHAVQWIRRSNQPSRDLSLFASDQQAESAALAAAHAGRRGSVLPGSAS